MALTLAELKDRLAVKDVDELLDLLGIDSETLVELASDIISDKYEELVDEVSDIDAFMPDEYRAH